MGTEEVCDERVIPRSTLATLRGILISSLSRENLGQDDTIQPPPRRRVTFQDIFQGHAGAAPADSQRHNAPLNNARSSNKDPKWLAHDNSSEGAQGTPPSESGKDGALQKEREDRIRLLRERQNEERQKKLEELKSQALAAQKFREQKEEERRKRIEELRSRDTDRRYQVEERKRQIWEAERDRREAILRKNQEREARIDSKRKNERSSIVFAFGSSTPRMLEPADTGGSFWGHRRATSTSNVMMFSAVPLTRRSSERELDGSKKRATSASGLDRKPEDAAVDEGSDAPNYNAPVNRRKTDLTPTLPSPRDTTPSRSLKSAPFSRSPGRAFSMSRLDQLSQPRRRQMACVEETGSTGEKVGKPLGTAPASVSRSMSHLAAGKQRALRKSEASRSMSLLTAPPVPPPRPTRAERLRQRAREMAKEKGLRSGEVTPVPLSRPLSALSQQSVNSVQSGVSLRSRPVAAARKPRPFSIAVTGVSQEMEPRAGTYRHSISGEIRTSKAMTSSVERMDSAKPPLPKSHATRRAPAKPEAPPRKVTDRVKSASAKASPRITPKATPLQSPGTEVAPNILQEQVEPKEVLMDVKVEPKPEPTVESLVEPLVEPKAEPVELKVELVMEEEEKKETKVKVEVIEDVPEVVQTSAEPEKLQEIPIKSEVVVEAVEAVKPVDVVEAAKVIDAVEKKEVATEKQVEKNVPEKPEVSSEEVDMTASMIAKTRITTEGEAKAALAERRRLAREQAEREAELERQRIEAERIAEEERMVQEEEEQRRFEEEQMRLLQEARKAEEERLLLAIQENEKREEEEKKRKEEEVLAKIEKEEADKKAREEAERLRQEMDERLKKEEEERVARRKRVEAIMLRTRGKGGNTANTPTKDGDSEGDEGKDESPTDEAKSQDNKSLILSAASGDNHVTDNGQHAEEFARQEVVGGGAKNVSSSSSAELLLIDNTNGKPMEISEEDLNIASEHPPQQSNGHRNGLDYNSVDFVNVDNMKQNKTTGNNLLDFSEFETLSNDQSSTSATDLLAPSSGKFMNEDNVNSNILNGPNAPFIAFSDNLTKKQDSNTVTDLLS